MAKPLQSPKQAVDLARRGGTVSRIRRDPPPPPKKVASRRSREREQLVMVVGVLSFALALFAILMGLSLYGGWSPGHYTIAIDTS